jgi:hypothetical protein
VTKRVRAITLIMPLIGVALPSHALEWEPVPSPGAPSGEASITWADSEAAVPRAISWEFVSPEEVIAVGASPTEQTPAAAQSAAAKQPIPFVTGGLYQVKRGNTWLPSISQRVPNGYGSTFGTLQTGLFVESCNVTGGYVCGSNDFSSEFKSNAKGIWAFMLGLGDPRKAIGIDLGYQITSLATTRPDQTSQGTSFGSGQGIDLAISRNLSEDVSIKLGAINLFKLDEVQQGDQPSSAFGVLSARFDLGGQPEENTNDLYFTLGAANGLYRPLNVIVEDQARTCGREEAQRGSRRQGKYTEPCLIEGFSYGDPYPVASVAYLVNPQLSLIAEWWGRNLTLAASIKPFESINWVITPGFTNLIKNADWDPSIPGYTNTPRFQLTTSIGF